MNLTWGGILAPHAGYVYESPEAWNWQGEGRPRWLEKAIFENQDQFLRTVEELLYGSLVGESAYRGQGLTPTGAELDKFLELHFYQAAAAAQRGEAPQGLSRAVSAEEFLSTFGQFGVDEEVDL